MDIDFYNEASTIQYPFIGGHDFEFGSGSVELENEVILDVGILFGIEAGFNQSDDSVYLYSVERDNDEITFVFRIQGRTVNIPVTVDVNCDFGTQTEFETAEPSFDEIRYARGFIITGDLSSLISITNNTEFTADTGNEAFVEPGCVQSLDGLYTRTVNVYNDPRLKVPDSIESSPEEEEPVLQDSVMEGFVVFTEGYNSNISANTHANSITLGAGLGHGKGKSPGEFVYEPEDFESSPNDTLLTGGPKCNELLYTINGIKPDVSNDFFIQGHRGIEIIPVPEENKIVITFELTRRLLCEV